MKPQQTATRGHQKKSVLDQDKLTTNNSHDKRVLRSSEQNVHSTTHIITYMQNKGDHLAITSCEIFCCPCHLKSHTWRHNRDSTTCLAVAH